MRFGKTLLYRTPRPSDLEVAEVVRRDPIQRRVFCAGLITRVLTPFHGCTRRTGYFVECSDILKQRHRRGSCAKPDHVTPFESCVSFLFVVPEHEVLFLVAKSQSILMRWTEHLPSRREPITGQIRARRILGRGNDASVDFPQTASTMTSSLRQPAEIVEYLARS
jgi:hypothetical protein